MSPIDPTVLLYAARWAFTTQTAAPRDVLSAIVIHADALRCDPTARKAIQGLISDEWLPEWDRELGPLRDTALRLLATEPA